MELKDRNIDEAMEQMLSKMAEAMIRYMDSDTVIPIDTHNLKDGLGVAVFIHGVLKAFKMNPRAEQPRKNIGKIRGKLYEGDIWGTNMIDKVMAEGVSKYGKGYFLVLYSSMPYDVIQDKSGVNQGWFSTHLSGEFLSIAEEIYKQFSGDNK